MWEILKSFIAGILILLLLYVMFDGHLQKMWDKITWYKVWNIFKRLMLGIFGVILIYIGLFKGPKKRTIPNDIVITKWNKFTGEVSREYRPGPNPDPNDFEGLFFGFIFVGGGIVCVLHAITDDLL